ncbi:MAG: hypothetical protein JSW28_00015, partial [Thermoplasmata archaeon]
MPMWYVKKNHKIWYEEIVGRGASDFETPLETPRTYEGPKRITRGEEAQESTGIPSNEDGACLLEDKGKVKEEETEY